MISCGRILKIMKKIQAPDISENIKYLEEMKLNSYGRKVPKQEKRTEKNGKLYQVG